MYEPKYYNIDGPIIIECKTKQNIQHQLRLSIKNDKISFDYKNKQIDVDLPTVERIINIIKDSSKK